jgi:hypothetical protein
MRYDKLVEMMKTIAREKLAEDIKHRSSSRSHAMAGRYGRRRGQLRLAQEDENTGRTMTGQKANPIETDTVQPSLVQQQPDKNKN